MAKIIFNEEIPKKNKISENQIHQGDLIYCEANSGGALSFWGIYSEALHIVISLDGAGDQYIPKVDRIYLYDSYNHWTIAKRIPCNKVQITITESN
jgi:hypothetical protein